MLPLSSPLNSICPISSSSAAELLVSFVNLKVEPAASLFVFLSTTKGLPDVGSSNVNCEDKNEELALTLIAPVKATVSPASVPITISSFAVPPVDSRAASLVSK